ncbi:hypothetical protein GCM10009868_03490 [Terrabacter aerolatus]|uniref:DUF306 domain-containing protein n=1 Tax=Terrabacter aerolatus TaxID=422442 RepID=A0A512CZJ0_9MICO|nr:META domain-containing protein [Terrabacter aerolatus]GEO29628.1 hypothetical protein TAE01_14380 [Terrabacter aerolatus]
MVDEVLAGTTWVVEQVGGVVTTDPRPQLSFDAEGRVTGSTGVNRVMGRYEAADGMLAVLDAATTRMAGPPEAMEQEQRLLAVLSEPQPLVVDGDHLRLGDAETVALLARPAGT